ncbi:MAG: exodeoxyribonuclease III, partial [Oscillospiraceae bacterium]
MKFISWNVNGFRACLGKGFEEYFKNMDADIFCIQETKMQPGQADFEPEGYSSYFHSAQKKGYSGTAVFAKQEPVEVVYGINGNHTDEGRVITCEYDKFYFVCCYVPNAQPGLKRISYRMEFEDDMNMDSALVKVNTQLESVKSYLPETCGSPNVMEMSMDMAATLYASVTQEGADIYEISEFVEENIT